MAQDKMHLLTTGEGQHSPYKICWLATSWMARNLGFDSWQWLEIFLFSAATWLALGVHPVCTRGLFSGGG
jgi:hypothetical protein